MTETVANKEKKRPNINFQSIITFGFYTFRLGLLDVDDYNTGTGYVIMFDISG